jgi:ATP-dependent helicase/DNAse subunit B
VLPLADAALTPLHLERLANRILRLLEMEREFRAQNPGYETVACELAIKGWYVAGEFRPQVGEMPSKALEVVGFIDRVDRLPTGELIAVDYKNSSYGIVKPKKWLEEGHVQMPFYIMALESGLTDLGPSQVGGAVFQRIGPPARKEISRADFESQAEGVLALIASTVRMICGGEFSPQPKDFETCDMCSWRSQCRAPHLSL